jgi:thioredoxin reductase
LDKKDVVMMSDVRFDEVTDKGLVITTKEGEKQTIEADTIITALPMLPNDELANSLKGVAPEIYAIGDCKTPAYIANAIAGGSRVARAI